MNLKINVHCHLRKFVRRYRNRCNRGRGTFFSAGNIFFCALDLLGGSFFSGLVFFAGLCADLDVDLISPLFNSVKRDVALFAALSPSFAVALNHSFTLDLSKSLPGNSSSNSGGYIALSIVSHALPYVESVRQRFAKSVG